MIVIIKVHIFSSHFVFVPTVILRGRAHVLTMNRGTADWRNFWQLFITLNSGPLSPPSGVKVQLHKDNLNADSLRCSLNARDFKSRLSIFLNKSFLMTCLKI